MSSSRRGDAAEEAKNLERIRVLAKLPGNDTCADCGAKFPRFASITLGVFLCNRCYGIHRNVGAHITRTKCIGLDTWKTDEVAFMQNMGNARAAGIWLGNLPQSVRPPGPSASDADVERWIRDKYEKRLYYSKDGNASLNKAQAAGPHLQATWASSSADAHTAQFQPGPQPTGVSSQASSHAHPASIPLWAAFEDPPLLRKGTLAAFEDPLSHQPQTSPASLSGAFDTPHHANHGAVFGNPSSPQTQENIHLRSDGLGHGTASNGTKSSNGVQTFPAAPQAPTASTRATQQPDLPDLIDWG